MFLTITTSKATPEQFQEVETFLHEFLSRQKQRPGVLAMYHDTRPEQGDGSTSIIWETAASWGSIHSGQSHQNGCVIYYEESQKRV